MIRLCPICEVGVMTEVGDYYVCDRCCFEMAKGSPNDQPQSREAINV